LGVTDGMIRSQLGSGRLVVLRKGVYLAASAWPGDAAGQHLARAHAEQAVNAEAVLSHQSAALTWGLPNPGFEAWPDLPPSVTLPTGGHSSRTTTTVHHVGPLPAAQVQRDALGYAVTSPARTAVDLAAGSPLPEALVVLDAASRLICEAMVPALRRRDLANPRLVAAAADLLAEAADTVRAGRLREVLPLVNPARESAAESLTAGHLVLAGLPRPVYQARILTQRGVLYPDCLWEEERLIGECDGAVKYADAAAYVAEKEREQILRDAGYRIVRWLAKEIMLQPLVVVDRIARALGI
jgi:hypothetical protein